MRRTRTVAPVDALAVVTDERVDAGASRRVADGGTRFGVVHIFARGFAGDTALGPRTVAGALRNIAGGEVRGGGVGRSIAVEWRGAVAERYAGVVRVGRSHVAFRAHAFRRTASPWTRWNCVRIARPFAGRFAQSVEFWTMAEHFEWLFASN